MNRFVFYLLALLICFPSSGGGQSLAVEKSVETVESEHNSEIDHHQHQHHSMNTPQDNASQQHHAEHDCCDDQDVSIQHDTCCESECDSCSFDCGSASFALLSVTREAHLPSDLALNRYLTGLPESPYKSDVIPPIA